MAGYNPLTVQQFDVFDELADVLETKLVGVNSVLAEMLDFYEACIAEQLSDNVNLQPFRDLFQRLGKSIKALCKLRSVSFTYIWFLPFYHDPMRYMKVVIVITLKLYGHTHLFFLVSFGICTLCKLY